MSSPALSAIAALDRARGIGLRGELPWRLSADMAHFKRVTLTAPEGKRNALIMGRKTFQSIPPRFRPLPGRLNVVLSRGNPELPAGVLLARDLEHALALSDAAGVHQIFAIGGASVYQATLEHPRCAQLHLTRVDGLFDCDVFFPVFEHLYTCEQRSVVHEEGELCYRMETHARRREQP